MKSEKLGSQRRALFAGLEEEFTNELIPAKHNEDEEARFDSLTVFFEDLAAEGNEAIGEFFFLPFVDDADSQLQVFVNYFTIAEDVNEENLGELVYAISVLNAYIPVGAYAFDAVSRALVYRHTAEIELPVSDEQLKDRVDLSMGMAVDVLQRFSYMLLEVNDGDRDAESVLRAIVPEEK